VEEIRFLHAKVGNTEWSGIMLMRVNGTLSNLQDMVVRLEHIYLTDIGSSVRTTFFNAEHLPKMSADYPEWGMFNPAAKWANDLKPIGTRTGLIHTHHNMSIGTEFSSVDLAELQTNVGTEGFYISLIVHMNGKYSAKGVFVVEEDYAPSVKAKDYNLNIEVKPRKIEKLAVVNFDICFETTDKFIEQYEFILEESKKQTALMAQDEEIEDFETLVVPNFGEVYFFPGSLHTVYDTAGNQVPEPIRRKAKNIYLNSSKHGKSSTSGSQVSRRSVVQQID